MQQPLEPAERSRHVADSACRRRNERQVDERRWR
jgi:hypothetical protein